MPSGKHREIIEEDRFSRELAQLISEPIRADEFVDGAKWLLARSPEAGSQIGHTRVWFLPMHGAPGLLEVVLYYTFDDDYVNLLSIQETLYPTKQSNGGDKEKRQVRRIRTRP